MLVPVSWFLGLGSDHLIFRSQRYLIELFTEDVTAWSCSFLAGAPCCGPWTLTAVMIAMKRLKPDPLRSLDDRVLVHLMTYLLKDLAEKSVWCTRADKSLAVMGLNSKRHVPLQNTRDSAYYTGNALQSCCNILAVRYPSFSSARRISPMPPAYSTLPPLRPSTSGCKCNPYTL